jgi:hypothetical protein
MSRPRKLAAGRYEYRGYILRRLRWHHEVIPRGKFSGRWVSGWRWFAVAPGRQWADSVPHRTLAGAASEVDGYASRPPRKVAIDAAAVGCASGKERLL